MLTVLHADCVMAAAPSAAVLSAAQAMPAQPTSTASAQAHKARSEQEMVLVSPAFVYKGAFTLHASHPAKFKSGFFKFSFLFGLGQPTDITETEGLERLGDETFQFQFVGEGGSHSGQY
jgi:hypothetical protein